MQTHSIHNMLQWRVAWFYSVLQEEPSHLTSSHVLWTSTCLPAPALQRTVNSSSSHDLFLPLYFPYYFEDLYSSDIFFFPGWRPVACLVVFVWRMFPILWLSLSHSWKFYEVIWSWGTKSAHSYVIHFRLFHFMKIVAVRDLCICLGFCSFFLKKKNQTTNKNKKKPGWKANQRNGVCLRLKRSADFSMTAMGKIDIISSADPPLGLLVVARKCYIWIVCAPHVDLTL